VRRTCICVIGGRGRRKRTTRKTKIYAYDNIKMDFGEPGCGGMDWIGLVSDRDHWRALVNTVTIYVRFEVYTA
jgi:hypothetical protein